MLKGVCFLLYRKIVGWNLSFWLLWYSGIFRFSGYPGLKPGREGTSNIRWFDRKNRDFKKPWTPQDLAPWEKYFYEDGAGSTPQASRTCWKAPFFTLEKNCWVESLVLAPMVFWNFQIFRLSWAPPGRGISTMTRYRFPLQPDDRKPRYVTT